jgi:stage V sporulation protein S
MIRTLDDPTPNEFKVSSDSEVHQLAHAMQRAVTIKGFAQVQAVGAGAVNQAIKAAAIAGLTCRPSFTNVKINGKEKTAIVLKVQ